MAVTARISAIAKGSPSITSGSPTLGTRVFVSGGADDDVDCGVAPRGNEHSKEPIAVEHPTRSGCPNSRWWPSVPPATQTFATIDGDCPISTVPHRI